MRIYISNGVPEEHTHGPIEDVLDLESQWSYGDASIEKKIICDVLDLASQW